MSSVYKKMNAWQWYGHGKPFYGPDVYTADQMGITPNYEQRSPGIIISMPTLSQLAVSRTLDPNDLGILAVYIVDWGEQVPGYELIVPGNWIVKNPGEEHYIISNDVFIRDYVMYG